MYCSQIVIFNEKARKAILLYCVRIWFLLFLPAKNGLLASPSSLLHSLSLSLSLAHTHTHTHFRTSRIWVKCVNPVSARLLDSTLISPLVLLSHSYWKRICIFTFSVIFTDWITTRDSAGHLRFIAKKKKREQSVVSAYTEHSFYWKIGKEEHTCCSEPFWNAATTAIHRTTASPRTCLYIAELLPEEHHKKKTLFKDT